MIGRSNVLGASLLVLVAMVTVTAAGDDKLFKKYGMIKIFESCFGKENARAYTARKHAACEVCRLQPVESVFQKKTMTKSSSLSSSLSSGMTPFSSPVSLNGFDFSSFFAAQSSGNTKYVPIPVFVREKRANNPNYKFFSDERVRSLGNKMEAKISNATCVMRELNYMDANNDLLFNNMISEIQETPGLDSQLSEDLIEAVEDCKDLSMCLPLSKKSMPLPAPLVRYKVFKKCNMKKKIALCMKKDLRAKRNQFDLSALEEFSDIDDDDKMMAIVWSQTVNGGYDF